MRWTTTINMEFQIPASEQVENFKRRIRHEVFKGYFWKVNMQVVGDRVVAFINISERGNRRKKRLKARVRKFINQWGGVLYYNIQMMDKDIMGSAGCRDWYRNIPKLTDENGLQTAIPNYLWNHDCVNFPAAIDQLIHPPDGLGKLAIDKGDEASGIKVFQFDNGYSTHPAVHDYLGYNSPDKISLPKIEQIDFSNHVNNKADLEAYYLLMSGYQKPGHSTSTAFTMIGKEGLTQEHWPINPTSVSDPLSSVYVENMGKGLFPYVKFTPIHISKTVVFSGRLGTRIFSNTSDPTNIVHGLEKAIIRKADVVTMSLGGAYNGKREKIVFSKLKEAYHAGIIVVCAAGNSSMFSKIFGIVKPARYRETIAVSALEPIQTDDGIQIVPWSESCGGIHTDISAPGKYIYIPFQMDVKKVHDLKLRKSLNQGNLYKFGGATSQATVHVAAAAALWKFHYKNILETDPFYFKELKNGEKVYNSGVVEAFRYALFCSRNTLENQGIKWSNQWIRNYKGLLDVKQLIHPNYAPNQDKCKRFIKEVRECNVPPFELFKWMEILDLI
ncbi:MAG: S8 family serine peptidase [Flavobacteriales bacterium]|nr:S8 family serine peptidase [Flavobacteriales bacterium]